ncbi:TPA: hypothetical protein ACH3X1_015620 [Trebouxia sp. C0004]
MFAGRRAQAYCLSPVPPAGGDLLVRTFLPEQKEPKAPSQLMASPAPNDERWRVFVSSCANTGLLILANSTTTVSHLQAETVRRHEIQYPEHDVASCRRLYAKHALAQGNHGWWAVAESHLISGLAPPGEVHFHADLFDSAGNQCQPLGQPAAASAAGQEANSEPAAAVVVNPPQPVLPPIEHPPLGHHNSLGHVDTDFPEVEPAPQESVSGGNSQQDGSLHISVPSASAVAAQRHQLQQQLLQRQQAQQQAQQQQQQAQHGSQRAQHGSQPAQQHEGNIQSVSHKRRLSQAFAQVKGVEQTPGDEAEEAPQVKRQRHGGDQAVMAQHGQNSSGGPDEPSGKKRRLSLSRQAYKQKQRARKNPPTSQAAHQSGMTHPSQPAALPTSRTPLQQGRQADVSMLLRPSAASAAAVMTDPGPSAAASQVTNMSDAKQPSGKLGRRQRMRLSFQRQLAAAQAAAVMQQQQQQQLPPPQNKLTVDQPASVPTQGASKISVKAGLQRPAASLKASDISVSAPGSASDSSSESSSGSETDPDVRLARSRKLTTRQLSSAAATSTPTAAAVGRQKTAAKKETAAEKETAANSNSNGEDEEEPSSSASASAASSPSSSSEEEQEEKQMSEVAAPAQMPEPVTAAADESSSSEGESESSSNDEEEEDQAALPASAVVPDQATSLQADASPESSSSEDEEVEDLSTAQPLPDQARVASNGPSTQPSSSEDEEDQQMPDVPASVSDQAPHASPEDSSDDSSSVSSDNEEEDEQNPGAAAVPLQASAPSSDEPSSDSGDSEEEEEQAPKLSVSAPDQAPPDTPGTTSSMSDDSSSDSSCEEEEDQPVPAATALLPDQAPPDSHESSSSDESSSDSSSEEDEDPPVRHAAAAARDLEPDVLARPTVPVQVAGSSNSFSSSEDSSSDSDSSEDEDVAMPDAAAVPDQAASGDSFSSSDESSIDSDSSEEQEGDEPMPEAAAAAPDQAPVAMPNQAPYMPAAVPNQAPAAPQSSSDFSSNGSTSSGSSDEEIDQAAAPAAGAAADESSGGSIGSKNQVSMAVSPAGNESSGECDNIASDGEEAEDRSAAAQLTGHVADESSGGVGQEGEHVLQAATDALRTLSTEAPSDLTSSGASSSSSDSSAASAPPSSSSDDAISSGAPLSSSPRISEGSRDADANAAAAEEADVDARGRMTDDSAYDPAEGSMNESDYAAPVEPAPTWAHETLSQQPAFLNTYTSKDLKSLLSSAIEVKGLQPQRLEDEDDQIPAMDEQPGPSGAAPARAASAGQNAEDRANKQSKKASANDKGPLVVAEDSECLEQVAQRPHQDWGKADKLAQMTRRAVKAWLNEDRLTRGLKEVNSNIYINNTAPIWWPLPKWDSTQLHRKADCQEVYMALQKFMREAGQHQPQ